MLVLIISGAVPFVLSFWPGLGFYRDKRALFYSLALISVTFGAWDIFATWRGHWYFNSQGVWKFRLVNLPLEEWLFFLVVPFCCIFTWEIIKYLRLKIR